MSSCDERLEMKGEPKEVVEKMGQGTLVAAREQGAPMGQDTLHVISNRIDPT